MSGARTHARLQKAEARPVSKPHDRHEHEAERAAEIVARDGSVAGWSFSAVSATALGPVQRQEDAKPKTDDEKKKEAAMKVGEALLETPQGKALKEKVLADPLVKTVKDAVTSPGGIVATGVVAAGGVGVLGAAHKSLPFQPPAIPLDKITPGLSAQVKLEGPVDRPTFVGLTITYKEQGPKGKKQSESDRIAADLVRLRAQEQMFTPASQKAAGKAQEDEMVQAWIKSQSGLPSLTIPLKGTPKPEGDPPRKDEEQKPVQPAPASASAVQPAFANVDGALATPGRPLDARVRRTMEARFGYDFSAVRVHDDERAATAAASVNAAAFTVGENIAFGIGRYDATGLEGRQLIAHELAHVVQQSQSPRAARGSSPVQRKVVVNAQELTAKERAALLARHKWADKTLARAVLDDMANAGDPFDFTDEAELTSELVKRVSTTGHMVESQQAVEKIPGDRRSAFGYPFTAPAALYGPRVNYSANDLWKPAPPDNYAQRTDKARNKALLALPRHQRHTVYGDMDGGYSWTLTDKGKVDTYSAIAFLFVPQQAHKRTLLHCDYLISIVNFMALADSLGKAEFNKRIVAFGADKIRLRFDAFTDLHPIVYEAIVGKSTAKPKPGLGSMQRVAPSTEADFVIGDHVVFFNHLAYDLINQNIGNAWRLENAVLIRRDPKGGDIFLGHGSGRKTTKEMHAKLAEEFNDVAKIALALTSKAASKDSKISANAQAELTANFPALVKKADGWHIAGKAPLCDKTTIDEKLHLIKPDEVLGPKDPCNPAKMYVVERPLESAKGKP